MKIKLGKIVRVLIQLVAVAPIVIGAIKPVVDKVKRPKKQVGQDNGAPKPPNEDRSDASL